MRPTHQQKLKLTSRSQYLRPAALRTTLLHRSSVKSFTTTPLARTSDLHRRQTSPHVTYYQTHGRALFKCLTLAFLTYQIVYWTWLTLETEEIKDQKNREIKELEREVKLLEEGRKSHLAEGREGKGSGEKK
jgi:hypothetical protein